MLDNMIRRAKLLYSSSPKIQGLTKKIATSNLYYRITKAKVKRQLQKDQKGPFNLIIETANICNARCIMCPYRLMKRPKKIMDQETFARILARIEKEKLLLNKIFFSGMGEPLTDPNLVSRIEAVKELGFAAKLYTNASLFYPPRKPSRSAGRMKRGENKLVEPEGREYRGLPACNALRSNAGRLALGSLLTPKIAQQLVDLGIDEINISFNGVTPEQYRKVMGLDFSKTEENINGLLRIRKESRGPVPAIRISSIITEENEEDIKKHVRKWSSKVDSVTVSLAHEWGGAVKINAKIKMRKSKRTYPCRSLWHTFNIDSRGNFVICCRDYESQYVLGNIRTHSFTEIQKSSTLDRFRRTHLGYSQRQLPKMCQHCNFPYQDGIEWYLPRSID